MKTTVIHHNADFDGIFCLEIARKFLPPDTEFVGWDYRDEKIPFPKEGIVYVLDLSPECFTDFMEAPDGHKRLVWIDHHKTAFEKFEVQHKYGQGYRIDGVAACRLAWFYFVSLERYKSQTADADFTWFQGNYPWAKLEDFIDRKLDEPIAVRLAGEYDIWDKRDPRAETFQFGLRSEKLSPEKWNWMFIGDQGPDQAIGERYNSVVMALLEKGGILQTYQQRSDAGTMPRSYVVHFEGLNFLALNTARCNSLTFAAKDVPETGHDALMGFYFDGTKWNISLYHANHRKELDLSEIAKKFGGGGHRGACGFQSGNLPGISDLPFISD